MMKYIGVLLIACIVVGGSYVRSELFGATAQDVDSITFSIESGESVAALAQRLETEQIIRSSFFFRQYLQWKGLDTTVRAGNFTVEAPITLARVVAALQYPSQEEREITIIPGWTLKDIAEYFVAEGIATSTTDVYTFTGNPAQVPTTVTLDFEEPLFILQDIPDGISLEGYLRPDTYRIFVNSSLEEVLRKIILARDSQISETMRQAIQKSGRTVHQIMTVASLLEKEVRGEENKRIVSDLFWRRYDTAWPMQADSSVHYIFGTSGSVFTTKEMRDSLNPYNTYKYPGLPPGPIGTPSLLAIEAAIDPEPNDYWYFLTTLDTGEVKYGRTLDEHNVNVQRYLR
jgi:UPF0755 protein